MTLRLWRVGQRKYAKTAATGEGAKRTGGRWNSPGVAVVYTAGSLSLAVLEVRVHLSPEEFPVGYVKTAVDLPADYVQKVPADHLPRGWKWANPPRSVRRFGDEWVAERRSVALRVPSAVVDVDYNYLLNPAHPDFSNVVFGEPTVFRFDPRLFGT